MYKPVLTQTNSIMVHVFSILCFSVNHNTLKYFGCLRVTIIASDVVSLFHMSHMVHLSVPRDGIFLRHCTKGCDHMKQKKLALTAS